MQSIPEKERQEQKNLLLLFAVVLQLLLFPLLFSFLPLLFCVHFLFGCVQFYRMINHVLTQNTDALCLLKAMHQRSAAYAFTHTALLHITISRWSANISAVQDQIHPVCHLRRHPPLPSPQAVSPARQAAVPCPCGTCCFSWKTPLSDQFQRITYRFTG